MNQQLRDGFAALHRPGDPVLLYNIWDVSTARAVAKAGAKAAGVVVDDTAVTPRYVHGVSPQRELPIIARIAKGSGTSVQQVNGLIKQFSQMRKVMKQLGKGRMPDLGAMMGQRR